MLQYMALILCDKKFKYIEKEKTHHTFFFEGDLMRSSYTLFCLTKS